MMKKIVMMIALSTSLTIGLISTVSAKDRQEIREAADVDAGDRKEVREAAGVDAGDRVDRRSEIRR